MPERPKPDLDHTREALRRHDERVEDDAAEESASDDVESGQDEEEEPETPQ